MSKPFECSTFKRFVRAIRKLGKGPLCVERGKNTEDNIDIDVFWLGKQHILFCAWIEKSCFYWITDKDKLEGVALDYCPFPHKNPEDQFKNEHAGSCLARLKTFSGWELMLANAFRRPLLHKALSEIKERP